MNMRTWNARRWTGNGLMGLVVAALAGVGFLANVPPNIGAIASHPNPVASYAEAVQRVIAIQAQEATGYNPLCKTQLLTHGQKTARAITFIHGYTNCPNQFLQLGQQFYDLGYNVLLVPMPHQGLADVMTTDLSKLTAEEMAAYADELVDISRGLGERVTMVGLSQGGVVAGWAAQNRSDLDQAVLLAPGFGLKLIPTPLTVLTANVALLLPEFYRWWGDLLKNDTSPQLPPDPKAVQGYPRFSIHGLAQQLRLGFAVRALASHTAPAARSIIVVTNGNDLAVENTVTADLVATWRAHGAASVVTYEFPKSLGIDHDMIDPHRDDQEVALIYPKLIELINVP
jgi:pimeloyl-ACP methyl ester carboxylesterase